MKWFLLGIVIGILGCQQKPTLGVSDSGVLVQEPNYKKILAAQSVIFDTRSPFDFNISKVPGSINLPVSDFNSSLDLLDSARRLSLYGVNLDTPVVIIGEGKGEEQKLAWEFIKLGVTQIETLNTQVFRMMNLQPEPPKKNVSLWKPHSAFSQINEKEFKLKMKALRPQLKGGARSEVFQGFPVDQVLTKRVLVISPSKEAMNDSRFDFVDKYLFNSSDLYDDKGLLRRELADKRVPPLGKYDAIFLKDSSPDAFSNAYALVQFGAPSLFLVR
jgi:rhodanese-related sulfurtransferase